MKNIIEDWIHEQNFNETINRLFEESVLCYHAKAYRAALLFSFTAFQKIIKFRLINAPIPKTYEDKKDDWTKILKELSNEDRVDYKIKQCVDQNKETNQIFLISDDLRNQYTYWKDRRNDCAHGKSNIIEKTHVESFWLFLKSNLSKFQVNGGKESLLNRIIEYFDDDATPIHASADPIIKDITNAVAIEECEDFYLKLINIAKSSALWDFVETLEDKHKKILLAIFTLSEDYRDIFIRLLENNPDIFIELLREDTSILRFLKNPMFIRKLWRRHIKKSGGIAYNVVADLLKYNLVPPEDKEELFEYSLNNYLDIYFKNVTELNYQMFKEFGFIDYLEEKALFEGKLNDFKWSEKNRNLIIFYIKYTKVYKKGFIKSFNNAFIGSNYPYKLKDSLTNLFEKESQTYERMKEAFEIEDIDFPDLLKLD